MLDTNTMSMDQSDRKNVRDKSASDGSTEGSSELRKVESPKSSSNSDFHDAEPMFQIC